jgi:adenylylsulfate kinase
MNGVILWLTGLSGSGKSTLAKAVGSRVALSWAVEILDGDEVRRHLSKGLGFTKEDRDTNVRRIGFVAHLLARHGVFVITAAISPYAEIRNEIRRHATADGIRFVEVFVTAPLSVLVQRDVKGLYARALNGTLPHFTGISDPYEPPTNPEVTVSTDIESETVSVNRILDTLGRLGVLGRGERDGSGAAAPDAAGPRPSRHSV